LFFQHLAYRRIIRRTDKKPIRNHQSAITIPQKALKENGMG
jgi:hypothetical protein